MAKSRKRKAARGGANPSRRRHNPFHRRHTRRRNPLPVSISDAGVLVASGAIGGIASAYIPNLVLGAHDTGWLGYLANAAVAFIPPMFLSKWRNVSLGWLVGGGTMVVGRIVDDLTGQPVIQFQGPTGVGSFYGPGKFPLPGGNMFGQFARGRAQMALPAASATPSAVAQAAAPAKGMGWVRNMMS